LELVKRVIRFKLRFVDTWRPQIESIASFMTKNGIRLSSVGRDSKPGVWQAAYRLDITEVNSVIVAATALIGQTVKKRLELETVVKYLEGRITGNQALAIFNAAVRSGRRRGKTRPLSLPFTRGEGLRLSKLENAERARAAHAVVVSAGVQRNIRRDHEVLKLGQIKLSRKYGYSVSVIRRVLGEK